MKLKQFATKKTKHFANNKINHTEQGKACSNGQQKLSEGREIAGRFAAKARDKHHQTVYFTIGKTKNNKEIMSDKEHVRQNNGKRKQRIAQRSNSSGRHAEEGYFLQGVCKLDFPGDTADIPI